MNIIDYLISGLIGAVIGYIFNEFVVYLREKRKESVHSKRNRELLREFLEKDYSMNKDGIVLLAHGTPSYSRGDIEGYITDKRFYYPIPQVDSIINHLAKYGFEQKGNPDFNYTNNVNCLSDSFWGIETFNHGLASFGNYAWDNTIKSELDEIAKEVAMQFISDLDAGAVRFNGAMFGVSSFHPNRSQGDELPTAKVYFYKTDYFTYRVFSHFYLKHRDDFLKKDITGQLINNLAYPFLTSFGVAIIAVASTNGKDEKLTDSDVLIIGKRSKNVVVDKGLLHFTMNEAFSIRDTIYKDPSLDLCVSRGFDEELKWTNDVKGLSFGDCKFIDFMFDSNKCEMGITGYIKLSIGENLSVQKLYELYKVSQDGILETEGLEFVEMKHVHGFYAENKHRMSAAYSTALDCFMQRYDNGLL